MAQLNSPGVSVTVVNESFYVPAAPGTVPLIIVASAQDKSNAAGTGTATATSKANAGQVQLLTSQKDVGDLFGTPFFETDASNNPIHAGERNEYGLQAAYSLLGVSNRAYVVRADIDTSQLQATGSIPSGAPADGTLWLDTNQTAWGIFEWNSAPITSANGQTFSVQSTYVITDPLKVNNFSGGDYTPKSSIGMLGDYAIVSVTSLNKLWFKKYQTDTAAGTWVEVGTGAWIKSWPTVTGTISSSSANILSSDSTTINNVVLTGYASVSAFVSGINSNSTLASAGITAAVINGFVNLYSTGVSIVVGASNTLGVKVGITAGTYLAPSLTLAPHTQVPLYGATDNPTTVNGYPTGSLWVKTTTPNQGANIFIKKYSATTKAWTTLVTYLYANNQSALNGLDPLGGGINLAQGQLYVKYNDDEVTSGTHGVLANFKVYERTGVGATNIVSVPVTASTFTSGTNNFIISESVNGSNSMVNSTTVTFTATGATTDASAFLTALTAALPATSNISTSINTATNVITISHIQGGDIRIIDGANAPFAKLFSTATTTNFFTIPSGASTVTGNATSTNATGSLITLSTTGLQVGQEITFSGTAFGGITAGATYYITSVSGANITVSTTPGGASLGVTTASGTMTFAAPGEYIATLWASSIGGVGIVTPSASAPTTTPADGTLWYDSTLTDVDIMVHNGVQWVGYLNYTQNQNGGSTTDPAGPIISATQPTVQSDGTPLSNGDLWINSSITVLEGFPYIYRYNYTTKTWVKIDNTDHTTSNGIIFHDARWSAVGSQATAQSSGTGTWDSIQTLLSSNYVDTDCPDPALYPKGMLLWNLRRSGFNVKQYKVNYINVLARNAMFPHTNGVLVPELQTTYYPDRWVSVAANQPDGTGSFGHKAQRQVILQALKATIESNQQIRDTESRVFNLIACPGYPEVIPDLVALNYDRGISAFVVGDTPARLLPDATTLSNWGNNVNGALYDGDNGLVTTDPYLGVYYPWGYSTDNLGNAIAVPPSHMMLRTIALSDNVSYPWFAPAGTRRGTITNASAVGYVDYQGEFQSVALNSGQRDTLAGIHVNPITYLSGIGLVAYGQYTRQLVASSLDRINVARLVIYLRRMFAQLAKPYVFEPNDKITRDELKGHADHLLLELVGQRALYDYLTVCDTSNNTPARIDRSELWLDVAIEPVKAAEFIYIPIRLENTGAIKGLTK